VHRQLIGLRNCATQIPDNKRWDSNSRNVKIEAIRLLLCAAGLFPTESLGDLLQKVS
jgi:hypothetical protein